MLIKLPPRQHLTKRSGIKPTPVDQPLDKLGLHKGMPSLTAAATRRHADIVQGRHSGLEARVIAAVRRMVVAASGELALRPTETLFRLGQIHGQWVNHGEGSLLQVSAQRKEGQ